MTEERELTLPGRTVETPPTVDGPAPRPMVIAGVNACSVGHATTRTPGKIDPQRSGISPSKLPEPRQLSPSIGYDPVTQSVISEQSLIENRARLEAIERAQKEVSERRRRWEGKSEEEILLGEVERRRPGTLEDPTWSFYATKDGYQAHLFGVTESVTPNQLDYTRRSSTWHILGRGILERLRRKRARQMDIEQTARPEVYEEQVLLLTPLVLLAGGEDQIAMAELHTEGIREPATKAKTQVHYLVRYLEAFIREEVRCQKVTVEGAAGPAASRSLDLEEVEMLRAEAAHLRSQLARLRAVLGMGEESE